MCYRVGGEGYVVEEHVWLCLVQEAQGLRWFGVFVCCAEVLVVRDQVGCLVIIVFNVFVVGCCKEVVVCVCFVLGIGEFKLNGRMFENYFLNKVY